MILLTNKSVAHAVLGLLHSQLSRVMYPRPNWSYSLLLHDNIYMAKLITHSLC